MGNSRNEERKKGEKMRGKKAGQKRGGWKGRKGE